jgi:transposase InsO family protein
MDAVIEIAPLVGKKGACEALGLPRAALYARTKATADAAKERLHPRALSTSERQRILDVLWATRFQDASPSEVHAALLDEGMHLGSVSTMYRILRSQGAVRERRGVRPPGAYKRPELVAIAPNQVWSWDITKVRGPDRRIWFHLYVMIDIFSRYIVGWMLAGHESGALAERFIQQTYEKWSIAPGKLTIHADRGTSMRSKTVAELMADLDIRKSHSRPRTSNDNPFSEAMFKTTKYNPYFPGSFESVAEGRAFFSLFHNWYNNEHHHSGIAMLTPATVHLGTVSEVLAIRQAALDERLRRQPQTVRPRAAARQVTACRSMDQSTVQPDCRHRGREPRRGGWGPANERNNESRCYARGPSV